jgi:hypothetical protein
VLQIVKRLKLARANNTKHGDIQTLLERLLVEVVAANYRYFLHEYLDNSRDDPADAERWCWPPLLANERQVSGLFAQALSSVCPVSRPEMGITRGQSKDLIDDQKGTKDPNGRIDFFATYGQRSIALELKRIDISTMARPAGWKGLSHRWKTVDNQARQALSHMRKHGDDFPYAVSIGLLVIRASRGVAPKTTASDAQVAVSGRFTALVDEVRKVTHPDFLAAYGAPTEMQVTDGWGKVGDRLKVFPGVIFAASVHVRDS